MRARFDDDRAAIVVLQPIAHRGHGDVVGVARDLDLVAFGRGVVDTLQAIDQTLGLRKRSDQLGDARHPRIDLEIPQRFDQLRTSLSIRRADGFEAERRQICLQLFNVDHQEEMRSRADGNTNQPPLSRT